MYNGNIASMAVNLAKVNTLLVYSYHYDQLNRLVNMDAYSGLTSNSFTPVHLDAYKEEVSYDPNGNIMTYTRNGDAARLGMDNMAYHYKPTTNQLDKVVDEAADAAAGEYDKYRDIKYHSQANGNYTYDAIGNLTSDASEGITGISWSVYGKILSITKASGTITYSYDASGNRISKTAGGTTTVYVRDASGNVMAVYEKTATTSLAQSEVHLYGSSRIGMVKAQTVPPTTVTLEGGPGTATLSTYTRGEKSYELSNHLGNVLVTVSDRRIGVSANGSTVDYYTADIISAQDYYPFGMLMPGRQYGLLGRYGFNGQEKSDEIDPAGNSMTAEFWQYDARIGRRWNVDPKPNLALSAYTVFADNPISNFDPKGDTLKIGSNIQSFKDIKSIARLKNSKYIKNDNNHISLDFNAITEEEKNKVLTNDAGLMLIDKLVGSSKNYLYEADELSLIQNENYQPTYEINYTGHYIVNASNNGLNSIGDHYHRPQKGYDGQVVINPKADYIDPSSLSSKRNAVVFHELYENFFRTEMRLNYKDKNIQLPLGRTTVIYGAHSQAIIEESKWHGKSSMPGSVDPSSFNLPFPRGKSFDELNKRGQSYLLDASPGLSRDVILGEVNHKSQ